MIRIEGFFVGLGCALVLAAAVGAAVPQGKPPADPEAGTVPVFRIVGDPPCGPGFATEDVAEGYVLNYNARVRQWISEADLTAALRDPDTGEAAPPAARAWVAQWMSPATMLTCRWRPVVGVGAE